MFPCYLRLAERAGQSLAALAGPGDEVELDVAGELRKICRAQVMPREPSSKSFGKENVEGELFKICRAQATAVEASDWR